MPLISLLLATPFAAQLGRHNTGLSSTRVSSSKLGSNDTVLLMLVCPAMAGGPRATSPSKITLWIKLEHIATDLGAEVIGLSLVSAVGYGGTLVQDHTADRIPNGP